MSELRLLRTLGATPSGLGELFVRHARKDGRSVATLRGIDRGHCVVVECEVFPGGADTVIAPGPFEFIDAQQAMAFALETVEALMYLGCDITTESPAASGGVGLQRALP